MDADARATASGAGGPEAPRRGSGRAGVVGALSTSRITEGIARCQGFGHDCDTRRRSVRTKPNAALPTVSDGRVTRVEWPGFRGAARDGIVRDVRINTDWAKSPPIEMWRRPIGPGWSSFAVHGDLLYTQEQRGDDEIVACYRVSTGEPVWRHGYPARFWEPGSGAGPRGTPTLSNGRVYTFGATGILNALDAATGAVVWTRNAAADAEVENPGWGFASSPLVVNDLVIVAASGRLAAATSPPANRAGSARPAALLQLATSDDDRRRRSDPSVERIAIDERLTGRRHAALGAPVAAGRRYAAAGSDRRG